MTEEIIKWAGVFTISGLGVFVWSMTICILHDQFFKKPNGEKK